MCTVTDIPLEKMDKMRPFLEKHFKQAFIETESVIKFIFKRN